MTTDIDHATYVARATLFLVEDEIAGNVDHKIDINPLPFERVGDGTDAVGSETEANESDFRIRSASFQLHNFALEVPFVSELAEVCVGIALFAEMQDQTVVVPFANGIEPIHHVDVDALPRFWIGETIGCIHSQSHGVS